MELSDMQRKDVIILDTGIKVGKIIDAKFDINTGKILNFTLEKKNIKNMFRSEDVVINYEDIKKIGEDVILVNIVE